MKILEVNKAYYPHIGGIESLVKQYSEGFGDRADVEVLACRDDFGKSIRQKTNGVKVLKCGSLGTLFKCPISPSFILNFRKMSKKADVIHIHLPFPLADLACLLSGYGGRVVVSWHSDIVHQKKLLKLYKPLLMRFLKRADIILAATEGHIKSSKFLQKFKDKCMIIPYGLDINNYLRHKSKPVLTERLQDKSAVKILFTGRLVYYKGVDVLLKAFSKVTENCELFIVGTGTLEPELKADVKRLGLSGKVHFMGNLGDDSLKSAFHDCDILVLPSVENSEAFGIVQLEAMICGKPVINTSLPTGVPYVSIDCVTGLTVPPNNANELAQCMNVLAECPDLRKKYGENGRRRVMEKFNNEKILNDVYEVLSCKKQL